MYSNGKVEKYSLLPERCNSCQYRGYLGHYDSHRKQIVCDYILIEHEKRGCPADENCNRYKKGKKIQAKNQIYFSTRKEGANK